MLVARKGNERKRPVVNFRLLNTRIVRRNTSTPLLRDIFIMLGRAQCQVLSCVDPKEAFHSMPLTPEAKEFCGILPYFGSPHFRYEVLLMGLAISPQVWIDYIENSLCGMANKQDYIAIMDDLLIHGFKGNHLDRPEALFKAMIKHELEMTGMAVNIHLLRHLLHRVEFDCAVDHRAIPYIMKAKTLPATTRIMRLLEILSGYAFNLYFVKGKDMKICDFLSRIDVDRGNPGEVIPISFNSFSMLNTIRKVTLHQTNKLLVTTRSKTKTEGATLPPVHGVQKHLDLAVKPEHDKPVAEQNKQSGPTSADAKPKVLLRPKLPASQIAKKRLIDRSIKLLNKPKSQINIPRRISQLPNQKPTDQKEGNLPNQRPVAQKEPPQRQLADNTDNNNPQPLANQPAHDNPIPVRHFEPNSLLEVPQQDKDPQEIVSQPPVHSTGNPNAVQDPFDTQMEVPFTEDIVEPVFKRPEMADFVIHPVLEEMILDGS